MVVGDDLHNAVLNHSAMKDKAVSGRTRIFNTREHLAMFLMDMRRYQELCEE
jgi:hypothetical protein